jgi:hypothetical protein
MIQIDFLNTLILPICGSLVVVLISFISKKLYKYFKNKKNSSDNMQINSSNNSRQTTFNSEVGTYIETINLNNTIAEKQTVSGSKANEILIEYIVHHISYYNIDLSKSPFPPVRVKKTDKSNSVKLQIEILLTNNTEDVINLKNIHIYLKDQINLIKPTAEYFTIHKNTTKDIFISLEPKQSVNLQCINSFIPSNLHPIKEIKDVIFSYMDRGILREIILFRIDETNNDTFDKDLITGYSV